MHIVYNGANQQSGMLLLMPNLSEWLVLNDLFGLREDPRIDFSCKASFGHFPDLHPPLQSIHPPKLIFFKETKWSLRPINFQFAEADLRCVFLLKLVLFAKTEYWKDIVLIFYSIHLQNPLPPKRPKDALHEKLDLWVFPKGGGK